MPPPFQATHFDAFKKIPYTPQGTFGWSPRRWVEYHGLTEVPLANDLSDERLTRHGVRAICLNRSLDVLHGYICAMAWGLQGIGLTAKHARTAWKHRNTITTRLEVLRGGGLTRSQAFGYFCGQNAIQGLGPSFFTKLLYFFSPEPTFYIMDQWTGKSVALLTGEWVVRMNGAALSRLNRPGNYVAYCEEVDSLARILGGTGAEMEERLFSHGGHNPWCWRRYLKTNWDKGRPRHRYDSLRMHQRYPHIPIQEL